MTCDLCGAPLVEQEVTYTLEIKAQFVVVEHVPAKVCIQCGERLFAPDIVEHLQKTLWEQKTPNKILNTPVFSFSSE